MLNQAIISLKANVWVIYFWSDNMPPSVITFVGYFIENIHF